MKLEEITKRTFLDRLRNGILGRLSALTIMLSGTAGLTTSVFNCSGSGASSPDIYYKDSSKDDFKEDALEEQGIDQINEESDDGGITELGYDDGEIIEVDTIDSNIDEFTANDLDVDAAYDKVEATDLDAPDLNIDEFTPNDLDTNLDPDGGEITDVDTFDLNIDEFTANETDASVEAGCKEFKVIATIDEVPISICKANEQGKGVFKYEGKDTVIALKDDNTKDMINNPTLAEIVGFNSVDFSCFNVHHPNYTPRSECFEQPSSHTLYLTTTPIDEVKHDGSGNEKSKKAAKNFMKWAKKNWEEKVCCNKDTIDDNIVEGTYLVENSGNDEEYTWGVSKDNLEEGKNYIKNKLGDKLAADLYVLNLDKSGGDDSITPSYPNVFALDVHIAETETCDGLDNDCNGITDDGGKVGCDDGDYCNGKESCGGTAGCQSGTLIECSAFNLTEIASCTHTPDGNNFTWDYFGGFTSLCDEIADACTIGAIALTHTCDVDNCGAGCDATHSCADGSCSAQYDDYCDSKKLVEFDTDKVLDFITINNTCANTCQPGCTCTACVAECTAPATNSYCVKDVCGAGCDKDGDWE
ncbi:hypothetical protein HZC32_02970 [Candidatus Woesearchaeota archaeon]|nr:hypothetical protein [Candidatus Woesearchaeota archaeon]